MSLLLFCSSGSLELLLCVWVIFQGARLVQGKLFIELQNLKQSKLARICQFLLLQAANTSSLTCIFCLGFTQTRSLLGPWFPCTRLPFFIIATENYSLPLPRTRWCYVDNGKMLLFISEPLQSIFCPQHFKSLPVISFKFSTIMCL